MILGVIRPVDGTWSAGERSPGAPFGASLTDRGLRLAVLAAVLPASPRIPEEPGHRERQCPQRVSGALPIRREHPEMVGESIVQGFLIASIILWTFGSVVSVYV
jgi:hypothetical protein